MEKQVIEVNGKKYPVHVGHRAMIEFERLTGKPFQHASTLEDSVMLLWLSLKYGAKSVFMEFPLSFEEFIDYVDVHPEVMDFTDEKKSQAPKLTD